VDWWKWRVSSELREDLLILPRTAGRSEHEELELATHRDEGTYCSRLIVYGVVCCLNADISLRGIHPRDRGVHGS